MKLVTVTDLAKYIGFDPGVASDKLDTATEAATQAVIGLLQTELDRAAVVDDFYVLSTGSLPIGATYRTRLALSRGFITGPVTMTFGSTIDDLALAPSPIDPASIKLDADLGGIVITGPDLRDRFIRVSYVAGFDEEDGLFNDLPEWLVEVAMMAAVASLDTTQPDLRFDKGQGAKESALSLQRSITARVAGKVRYFPNSTRPIG